MDIIEKLFDLQKQATTERSHYYVASCVTEAIQEITELRRGLKYLTTFQCDRPDSCGNGDLCNSCWARRWATAMSP